MKSSLRSLEDLQDQYGEGLAAAKLRLLRRLARTRQPLAASVSRLHEALLFLRAYPDDQAVLEQVEEMLRDFHRRPDLRRFAAELEDSGIAGTAIVYSFFHELARWLASRWGGFLTVEWEQLTAPERLERVLPLLTLWCETPALDELPLELRELVGRLKGPEETDAVFLLRRVDALEVDARTREWFFEQLDLWLRLAPGPDTPSRTHAKAPRRRIHYQVRALDRGRPDLAAEVARPPLSVRAVSRREGQRLIDLARGAMVTRSRDLDVFAYGDPGDVRLLRHEDGLEFASIGLIPERRLLFEAVYGFLTLKNGVPIGYVLNSALFGSAEVAYNVFDVYRGAEAGRIYGRVISTLHHLFGTDSYVVYPYQLGGGGNREGLESGAWWFYQKLGFRAREPEVLKRMEAELARMRRHPRHRSSEAVLGELVEDNVYLHMGRRRDDVIGLIPLAEAGGVVMDAVAGRFGSDREAATRVCGREAARALGLRSLAGFSDGERMAWERWAPVVTALPGLGRWPAADRRALVEVIRAKGGRRESDYVALFDAHARLRKALLTLGARGLR